MAMELCFKKSFSVIGKEGSTEDGDGFIQKLWEKANSNFNEVADLAKKDKDGNILGVWGAMSDFSKSFSPWEDNFSKGLYLAGVEVVDEAEPPAGWVKWTIPSFQYAYTVADSANTFSEGITYLNDNKMELVGAVQEYNCPEDGQVYLFYPIGRVDEA